MNGWAQRFGVGVDGEQETPPPGYRSFQRHSHPARRRWAEKERLPLNWPFPVHNGYLLCTLQYTRVGTAAVLSEDPFFYVQRVPSFDGPYTK